MRVIAVIAQKGGTGKTTLTLSMAVEAQRRGQTVVVVDLDPQASASRWHDRREAETPVVVSAQASRLEQVLQGAKERDVDIVFIDTPPRAEQAAVAAAKAADLVLVPCRPAVYDLETVPTTVEIINFAGNPPVLGVLNGVPPAGAKHDQAIEVLEGMGLEVCSTAFGQRIAFDHAATVGLAAQEYEPGGKAAIEVYAVYDFMSKLINSSTAEPTGA